jgi:hypothetical protein
MDIGLWQPSFGENRKDTYGRVSTSRKKQKMQQNATTWIYCYDPRKTMGNVTKRNNP